MKSSILKLLVAGMLALFLSACASYPHAYYPAGGTYSGYGFTQRSYYGGYPYRYDNYTYPYNSKYRYDNRHYYFDRHDDYNSYPSWNNRYVRPKPSNDYRYNHNDRKHQQFGYQGSVPTYRNHNDHNDLYGNNNWSKHPSDRRWEHHNPQHGRPNSDVQNYRQNQRSDDRGNQIKGPRNHEHKNHEQAKDQRESRRRNN